MLKTHRQWLSGILRHDLDMGLSSMSLFTWHDRQVLSNTSTFSRLSWRDPSDFSENWASVRGFSHCPTISTRFWKLPLKPGHLNVTRQPTGGHDAVTRFRPVMWSKLDQRILWSLNHLYTGSGSCSLYIMCTVEHHAEYAYSWLRMYEVLQNKVTNCR